MKQHPTVRGGWSPSLQARSELAQQAHISAIVPVTHGATAALVDEHELVLPIMDYKQALPLATLAPMQYISPRCCQR